MAASEQPMSTAVAAPPPREEAVMAPPIRANIGRLLCVAVPLVVWFAPIGIDTRMQHVLAIAAFMIVAWITEAIDYAVAGFVGCYLYWALGIVPFNVAFSGFANDTPWFLFGAGLFGAMATKTGLARRIALFVMRRIGHTYGRLLLGLIITDFVLTFVIPSGIARVVVMSAVALGLVEAFGVGPGSNIGRAMFLIVTYTASIFDKMIIAGAASITARGAIERFGGVEVLWSRWFLAYLPCDILTILIAWRLTLWIYPPEKNALSANEAAYLEREVRQLGGWTAATTRAALLIALAIGLWLTDFLHHISPSIIGLGVGLAAVLPGIGVLSVEDLRRVNYLPVFFVAAAISMGEVLAQTKTLDLVTNVLLSWMEPLLGSLLQSTLVLYWTAFAYHILLASEISMLGTSVPVLMQFAKEHAMNPLLVGMIWTFGAGGKLFAYQSGVLIVGMSYGYFGSRDLLRMGLLLTLVQCVLLLLVVFLYWPMIGIR
jgi:solute carrier family 13 (sodium-dependent dicarboxylate transporter), member 2/3/5